MNIFVIGNGMYTTGRGTDSYGTILPSILEFQRNSNQVHEIFIIGSSYVNSRLAKKKYLVISKLSNVKLNISFYPKNKNNKNEYKKVIKSKKGNSCAIVATPDHLHYEMIRFCLENYIHTLCVKPLTPSFKDSKILTDLAKKNNIYGAVEFHKRYDKQNILAKNKVNDKKFGDLLYNIVEYSQRKKIPTKIFSKWISKTNLLQYLGVHYIDLLFFFTGAKPMSIMVLTQKNYLKNIKKIDTHDSMQCVIKWKPKSGQIFTQIIFLNWIDSENNSAMSDQKFKIISTCGRFEADQKNRGIETINDFDKLEHPNPDFCHKYIDENNNHYWSGYGIDSIKNFLNDTVNLHNNTVTLKDLSLIRSTFKSSLVSSAVLEAGNLSIIKNSKWIKINL